MALTQPLSQLPDHYMSQDISGLQLPNTVCVPRGVCGKSSSTYKIEKTNGVFYTPLQIGPSRSSSCNEFPIAASFFLSAVAFTSEEPPKSSEACSPGWSVQAEGHVARSPGSFITQAFWGLLQKLWQET